MIPIKSTFFPIVPKAAMRATADMSYLVHKTEEEAIAMDEEYKYTFTKLGMMWVRTKWDRKSEQWVTKARKSKPTYKRTRKYLIEQYANKAAIKEYGLSIGYVIPEDYFNIVVCFPMAKSWTKKKKAAMSWQLHKQRPDSDNIEKNIFDSLYYKESRFVRKKGDEDARISSKAFHKYWVGDDVVPGFWIDEYAKEDWEMIFVTHR
jgi:Holliday junction resolvase RusA-like endonuclease